MVTTHTGQGIPLLLPSLDDLQGRGWALGRRTPICLWQITPKSKFLYVLLLLSLSLELINSERLQWDKKKPVVHAATHSILQTTLRCWFS